MDSSRESTGSACLDSSRMSTGSACLDSSRKRTGSICLDSSRRSSGSAHPGLDDTNHTDGSGRSFQVLEKQLPKLYSAKLAPLDLTFDLVREDERTITLKQAHKKALKGQIIHASRHAQASVLFVVKRPGCILCHEQGLDLANLLDEFPAQSVAAFACVKEINVDNPGLLTLYNNYFNFPFYRDVNLQVYKALGERRASIPMALLMYPFLKKRWQKKGLSGNMIGDGEGMVLGGIMVFNRSGELQYTYQEKFGEELPVNEIREAIQQIIN
jgi:AhpC/TSA antioxidant enzyme